MDRQTRSREDGILKSLFCKTGILCLILALFAPDLSVLPADPDLWWHLKSGAQILSARQWVYQDIYSYSFYGAPWIHHEWLSSCLFAALYQGGGESGLWILHAVLLVLFLLLFFRLLNSLSSSAPSSLLLMIISMPFLSRYLILRSQVFSYLLTLLLLIYLNRSKKRGFSFSIFFLIGVLWANLHGGFLLGLGLCALYAALSMRQEPFKTKILMPLSFLAGTLINPYGIRLYGYLYRELTASHALISEWQPFLAQPNILFAGGLFLFFMILPVILILRFKTPRSSFWICACLLAAAGALLHRRFFGIYVLTSCLLSAFSWQPYFTDGTGVLRNRKAFSLYILSLLILLAPYRLYSAGLNLAHHGMKLKETHIRYPFKAVTYLKQNFCGKKLFTAFQWGGYALFHLHPEYQVSIDGRNLTVYDDAYVSDYLKEYQQGDWSRVTGPDAPDCLLIERNSPFFANLPSPKEWKVLHIDELAVVLKQNRTSAE